MYFLITTVRSIMLVPRLRMRPSLSRTRQVLELVGASIWLLLFVAAGVSLIGGVGGGFYIVAFVMLFMFGWNVYVAWVLITDISD